MILLNTLNHDSVEHKKGIDELFTENQKLSEQLKKTNELSTKNQLLNNQLKDDSVEHKKRIDELFTENQLLRKDSVEHKKRIDELFTENQRLNQGQYRSVLQEGSTCLYLDGYRYYQITLASLPVTRIIKNKNGDDINVKITVSPKNNVVALSFEENSNGRYTSVNPLLVDAAGQQVLRLKCVVQHQEYICKQSVNELKHMGYIVNDGIVLRIH